MQWVELEMESALDGEISWDHKVHKYREIIETISQKHPNVASWRTKINRMLGYILSPNLLKEMLIALPLEGCADDSFDL
jgi:hypothetical protein